MVRQIKRYYCWAAVLLAVWGAASKPVAHAAGGVSPSTPTQTYWAAFGPYFDGDYRSALDLFLGEQRGSIKTVSTRWIDSICYHTMAGECYYQMGSFAKALDQYTSALVLYSRFSQWMIRVQFTAAIQPGSPAAYKKVPWGASTRQAKVGHFSDSMLIGLGQLDNNTPVKQGGVIQMPQLKPINVYEVVRCTALAIRRRAELMGAVGISDPLTGEVQSKLAARPGPPNHWSEAWIDVQLGLAMMAAGRETQAIPLLQRSILVAGEYDHPLTPTALLVLGQIAIRQGNYPLAFNLLAEASYSAVNFGDSQVLEEAFRYGAMLHLVTNGKGLFPPLTTALAWAHVKAGRRIQAAFTLLAAENLAVLRQTADAGKMLDDARHVIGRRTMGNGWIGARLNFLTALVQYQQHHIAEGDAASNLAMNYMRSGSLWLFQVVLADERYMSGKAGMTARTAMDLYGKLLREPLPADWSTDPMEALAVLVTPQIGPLEHWFEVALERKDYESAIMIGDRIRRHRFFTSLGFGGRLQALRWILSGPVDALDKDTRLQRDDLLVRYAGYDELNRQADQIRKTLAERPLAPQDQTDFRNQSAGFAELSKISLLQEAMLREIAVRREPANMIFPPLRKTEEVQKALPTGHAALVFLSTSRQLYAFLLNSKQYGYWQVSGTAGMYGKIQALLRQIGNYDQNADLGVKELADSQWKQTAKQLLESMLKGSQADFAQPFDELVIVPDGALWYLPFEALQVTVNKQSVSLISRFRIRYAPTFGMVLPDGRGRKPSGRTAVAVGPMLSRDTEPASRAAFEQLARVVPKSEALHVPLAAPSALASSVFDRLVVYEDTPPGEGPYAWFPVPSDRSKVGGTLNDWMALPWAGPQDVILPAYHTAAESALKRVTPATAGNEVFFSLCGLMASGARTVLMSRWRTGGQTSFDLAREFTQELPNSTAADAFQRAVFLTVDSQLNPDAEPRLKRATPEDSFPKAVHPFFWGGFLMVDWAGDPRQAEVPPAAAPVAPAVAAPGGNPAVPANPAMPGNAAAAPANAGNGPVAAPAVGPPIAEAKDAFAPAVPQRNPAPAAKPKRSRP